MHTILAFLSAIGFKTIAIFILGVPSFRIFVISNAEAVVYFVALSGPDSFLSAVVLLPTSQIFTVQSALHVM